MKQNGIVGRGPLSSGPASEAQEAFAEDVVALLSPAARSRVINFSEGGSGTLFINYYNVPPYATGGGGAERENNRLMLQVEGFRQPKQRVELMIRFAPSKFGDPDYKLRAKTGSASVLARYVADHINFCAKTPPHFTHSSPREDLEPNRNLTRFQLERLLLDKGGYSKSEIANMTDDQIRRHVGHDTLRASGDLVRNGIVDGEGDYFVSGAYSDGTICESFSFDGPEEEAIAAARKMFRSATFQGDSVRVITLDGDHVYSYPSEDADEEASGENGIETDEFDAPAHWASAFVNGDTSGLEEDDLADFESWCEENPGLTNVVDVSEDTHIGRFNGLQTELATYTCHVLQPNARRPAAAADERAARELSLYIENDYALVGAPNSQGKAIEANLLRKIRNGTFDLEKSEQAWMYLMETGAKKYAKEFASAGDWHKIFSVPTRELVAHEFATTFAEENGIRVR